MGKAAERCEERSTFTTDDSLMRDVRVTYSKPTSPGREPSKFFGRGTKGIAWDISWLSSPPRSLLRAVLDLTEAGNGANAAAVLRDKARMVYFIFAFDLMRFSNTL